ncbi:MAG: hypothetical protein Q4B70_11870 [Lachnospiraceae bacterium]|nr:hypothetical protein [Lachnospiraceae bacterium]
MKRRMLSVQYCRQHFLKADGELSAVTGKQPEWISEIRFIIGVKITW